MKEELILQNPWWQNKENILTDDKIRATENAKPQIKYKFIKENTVFLGSRQVGKTTYLKSYIKYLIEQGKNERNLIYFSCEPLSTKKDLINLFKEIEEISLNEEKKYLFLDEITAVENWEQAIKYLLEQKIIKNFQLICTGSNAHLLKKGIERFPGRNIEIKLFFPLTFSEYFNLFSQQKNVSIKKFNLTKIYENCKKLLPQLKQTNKELNNYIKTGGLPKAIYYYKKNQRIDSEIYEIYTRWILGSLAKLNKRESIFRSLIKAIVTSYTSQVSLNSLAKDFQIPTHTTVETYLEILNQLLLINILYKIDPKTQTPLFRKNKKIYFQDPFFYNVFKGYVLGKYQDYSETDSDKIIEGLVCQALSSINRTNPEINEILWYYGTEKETDFAIKNRDKLNGFEVKWISHAEIKDFNNKFAFKEKVILSKKTLFYDKEKNFYILPLSLFLLSLNSKFSVYS